MEICIPQREVDEFFCEGIVSPTKAELAAQSKNDAYSSHGRGDRSALLTVLAI